MYSHVHMYMYMYVHLNVVLLRVCRKKKGVREGGEQPGKGAAVKRTNSFGNKKELVLRRTGSLKRNKRYPLIFSSRTVV